jgi:hypothetical protein
MQIQTMGKGGMFFICKLPLEDMQIRSKSSLKIMVTATTFAMIPCSRPT